MNRKLCRLLQQDVAKGMILLYDLYPLCGAWFNLRRRSRHTKQQQAKQHVVAADELLS